MNQINTLTGVELISLERKKQVEELGRTLEHDIVHNPDGELEQGAYALLADEEDYFPVKWDAEVCKKMVSKSHMDRLIMAGALIAAEIDRLNGIK